MADIKIASEVAGRVWQVVVEPGAEVAEGDDLLILESMKMEIPVSATSAGTVKEILVAKEQEVAEGQVLVVLAG